MKQFNHSLRSLMAIFTFLFLISPLAFSQFSPGEGGSLPTFPTFTPIDGKFGGLEFENTQRENGSFAASGTRSLVEMKFPEPTSIGAESYNLQISENNGDSWSNYQHYYEDLVLTGDNFSLSPDGSYTYRLKVNGGPKNGFTSNEVYAELSQIDTGFAGWSLDESMTITGIMIPSIGRGLQASFSSVKLSDGTAIEGHLNYQWYRVNPLTFEMTAIESANALTYTTVIADAGYFLAIRATGDNVEVGGAIQTISKWENLVSNNAYVKNVSQNGFDLCMYKEVASLKIDELTLRDMDYNEVPINNVLALENNASFRITAMLDPSKTPYSLASKTQCWRIVSQKPDMPMTLEGVTIDFNTGIQNIENQNVFSIVNNTLIFNSAGITSKISIMDSSGRLILERNPYSKTGNIQLPKMATGILIIRYTMNNVLFTQKLAVI